MCKKIVDSLDGVIFCTSQLNVGTKFKVEIPIKYHKNKEEEIETCKQEDCDLSEISAETNLTAYSMNEQ
jgi:hypothetical protein